MNNTELTSTNQPHLINLPSKFSDTGDLSFWDNKELFPLGIQRCFWISKVKKGETRGNHAHYQESQVIVAMAGELKIEVTQLNGEIEIFTLNSSSVGLFVPPLNWISVSFSEGAILLGLCDQTFSEEDYIRDKEDFDNYQIRN